MWLLESKTWDLLQSAQSAGVAPTAEQQAQFEASHITAMAEGGSHILSIAGSTAQIEIRGVITKTPSFLAVLFGGGNVTFSDINSAIAEAEQDPAIDNIILAIDSPGGSVEGLFETLDVIKAAVKPIKALISNTGASAAFALAAVTDEIIAANQATRVGSIGILGTFRVDENSVSIASTNAPKKSPDVTTPEGVAMVREELDAVHEIFVEAIAAGRNVSTDTVNATFGQGGVLLAGEALKRGMIDSVAKTPLQSVKNTKKMKTVANDGATLKVTSMDLAKLKAEHPEAYAAAVAVGHEQGVTQERDRVGAHLTMGASSGDMKTAIEACTDGSEMSATLQAKYMSAGMNRKDVDTRSKEEIEAAAAANANGEELEPAEEAAESVASGLEAHFGTEVKS